MTVEEKVKQLNEDGKIKNILHLGAHLGHEISFYASLQPETIYWFEANPELIPGLQANISPYDTFDQIIFPYAVASENKKMSFNLIYSYDQLNTGCSSLLELEHHAIQYPHITKVRTVEVEAVKIDDFLISENLNKDFDLINIDIQGSEYDVLSTTDLLFSKNLTFQMFILETSEVEMYKGMKLESELTALMESKGYEKVHYEALAHNWGDSIYTKKS